VEEATRGRIEVGFLERRAKLETKEYLVEEAPRETLNRVEAYILRSGYWMVTGARTDVQASFSRTRGLLDLLSPFDGFFIKAVVSPGARTKPGLLFGRITTLERTPSVWPEKHATPAEFETKKAELLKRMRVGRSPTPR
jgi:hypothetical protein